MSASQCQANLKTNRFPRVSWKKISHLKQNFTRKYQSEKSEILSDIIFKLWKQSPGGVLSQKVFLEIAQGLQHYQKRLLHRYFPENLAKFLKKPFLQNTSGSYSSPYITINFSLSSILFDFADILISRNTKIFSLVFLLCTISTFNVYLKKKTCSNLSSECETSDKNRKKIEWKLNTSNFSTIK